MTSPLKVKASVCPVSEIHHRPDWTMRPQSNQHIKSQHSRRKHDRQSDDGFDKKFPSPVRKRNPVSDRYAEKQQYEGDSDGQLQSKTECLPVNSHEKSLEREIDDRAERRSLARRRNDPVHAEIYYHLPVVIESVRRHRHCQPQARYRSLPKRALYGSPSDSFR